MKSSDFDLRLKKLLDATGLESVGHYGKNTSQSQKMANEFIALFSGKHATCSHKLTEPPMISKTM